MADLKLTFAVFACVPPVLDSVTHSSLENFALAWNYDGKNHALYDDETTVQVEYSTDGGSIWNLYTTELFYFPVDNANITITGAMWEVIHFRLKLVNRKCTSYSNTIIIDIT